MEVLITLPPSLKKKKLPCKLHLIRFSYMPKQCSLHKCYVQHDQAVDIVRTNLGSQYDSADISRRDRCTAVEL